MSEHVMLDLETLGKGNEAAIVSIGAVKFVKNAIVDEFHVGVDLESSVALGLKMDASTVMWWLDPERAAARDALLSLERVTLPEALVGFSEWYGPDSLPTWGNGATFDNVLLKSAFGACRMTHPISYKDDRCYRTLKNFAPGVEIPRQGTHHDALDDARWQVWHLQAILDHLGIELS